MQIKYWRKVRNKSQVELAEIANIKYRHFQEIEAGRVDMKISTIGNICYALDLTPSELFVPAIENVKLMCTHCMHLADDSD